jgi:hypothetical protein
MFLKRLLSNDMPRSRLLALLLVALFLALAFAPFIFPGVKALSVAAKILVFVVLVASFDLLLGYTGIVSFAHTMFFGIGAYGIAISASRLGPNWGAVLVGWAHRSRSSLVLSFAIGPVLAAGARDLLRDDHAGGGLGVPDAGLAAVGFHRRRRRPDLQAARADFAELRVCRGAFPRRLARWPVALLLPAVRRCRGAGARAAAHRELALRPRAAGDPRERVPRRGHRLPRGGVPHDVQPCCRRCSPRWPARCSRSGCATTGPTPR